MTKDTQEFIIPLTRGKIAIVSECDFARVNAYRWSASCANGYWRATRTDENQKTVYMHRFIMNAPKGVVVDHINHDGLDNRRDNLRLASRSQNAANALPRAQFKGVTYRDGKWIAQIMCNGERIQRYGFDTAYDAALAYDELAIALFGEFAYTNFDKALPQ